MKQSVSFERCGNSDNHFDTMRFSENPFYSLPIFSFLSRTYIFVNHSYLRLMFIEGYAGAFLAILDCFYGPLM